MNSLTFPILSLITFFPLVGILFILFVNNERLNLIRWASFLTAVITFLISLPLYFLFDSTTWNMQFVEHIPWVKEFGISYHMGIDGISILLVLLTTFLSPLAILSTWTAVTQRVKGYMISLLFLEIGMLGVFCALDFFLFYVFWEVMLIPDVFHHWDMGRASKNICCCKIFHIYHERQRSDADRDSCRCTSCTSK